jgi:hypothetical protein
VPNEIEPFATPPNQCLRFEILPFGFSASRGDTEVRALRSVFRADALHYFELFIILNETHSLVL